MAFQDPKLKKAFDQAIQYYFDNNEFEEYNKSVGTRKYDKKYFDGLESELFPEKDTEKKKQSKEKKRAN